MTVPYYCIQPWDGIDDGLNHFWVSDGDGIPYNDFCGTETAIKKGVLWPYVEDLDLYKCLDDKGGFVRSFAILHAMASVHNYNDERNFFRAGEIKMPSQKGVFIDVGLRPQRFNEGVIEGVGRDGQKVINTFTKEWFSAVGFLTYRHNNGCNISYADGHVEPFKWKDKRTIELLDKKGDDEELKDYAVNNPDFDRLLPVIRGAKKLGTVTYL